MENESTYLLKKKQSCFLDPINRIKRVYWISFCHSKGALIVIILFSTVRISVNMIENSTLILTSGKQRIAYGILISGMYLITPALGYLGERINRYKIMLISVFLVLLSYLMYVICLIVNATSVKKATNYYITIAYIVPILPAIIGHGMYVSNLPQFGATQLQFASSKHLSAYARWIVWIYFLTGVSDLSISFAFIQKHHFKTILAIINGLWFLLLLLSAIVTYRLRHILIIDPPPKIDGLRLIWRVMKYSWKHKYPVRRSAFTYSEAPPTRLDLAKERYGGPFTTKQVEEVKSFWYLLLIPICHFLNSGISPSIVLGYSYTNCLKHNSTNLTQLQILIGCSKSIEESVAAIGLLLSQLIIVPFLSKWILGILQRMWIGLFLLVLSSASCMAISFNIINNSNDKLSTGNSNKLWPAYYLLLIPKVLGGLGFSLNLTSQFEFIFAQVPHNMQSIFVGALYTQYFTPFTTFAIGVSTSAGRHWEYYTIISCLQIFIFVTFSIIKHQYKYRQCNDISDVNIRSNIEEVYERDLIAAERHEKLKNNSLLKEPHTCA